MVNRSCTRFYRWSHRLCDGCRRLQSEMVRCVPRHPSQRIQCHCEQLLGSTFGAPTEGLLEI